MLQIFKHWNLEQILIDISTYYQRNMIVDQAYKTLVINSKDIMEHI